MELMKLREEEAELNRQLAGTSMEGPIPSRTARKGAGAQAQDLGDRRYEANPLTRMGHPRTHDAHLYCSE